MKNFLLIESKKKKLFKELETTPSVCSKFLLIVKFYEFIIQIGTAPIYESYILELLENYLLFASNYTPFFASPKQTEKVLEQLNYLITLPFLSESKNRMEILFEQISDKYGALLEILEGKGALNTSNKPFFPILEIKNGNCNDCTGFNDSATMDISIHKNKDVFIIIPSEVEIEERILQQVKTSFYIALKLVKSRHRIKNKFHKIIIQFDLRNGYYTGDSLGTALTIGFIEKLLSLYNTQYLVKIKSGITFTGGIDENGNIKRVTDEIISKKMELIFFSDTGTFIIPEEDKEAAFTKFQELKQLYPDRDLRIIPINDLYDLLDRRSLIEIKRQNPLIRIAKNIKRHKYSTVLSLLFFTLVSFIYATDYDNNPSVLCSEGQTLYVKNKSGRVLWTKQLGYNNRFNYDENYLRPFQLIMDTDNNGVNEIILTRENQSPELNRKEGRVVCFDNRGNEIWEYVFTDTISSPLEMLKPEYFISIIDTITIGKQKVLCLSANNGPSYSSAIFKLDPRNGQRLPGTLWHPGHFMEGFIKDVYGNGKKYIFELGINNSFEKCALIIMDVSNLDGQLPARGKYKFYNVNQSNPAAYILLPRSDYSKLLIMRTNSVQYGSLHFKSNSRQYCFNLYEDNVNYHNVIEYKYNPINTDFDIVIGSDFRVARDTLVAHGKLPLPLTDTPEYCNILKKQILFWNGKEFVKKEYLTTNLNQQ